MSRNPNVPGPVPGRTYRRHPLPPVVALFAFPNDRPGVPWHAVYTCPKCGREHMVGWDFPAQPDPGVKRPSCDATGVLVEVLAPPPNAMYEDDPRHSPVLMPGAEDN